MKLYQRALGLLLVAAAVFIMGAPVAAQEPASMQAVSVPVIMYHSLHESQRDRWTLAPSAFREDLEYLRKNGYTAVTMQELVDFVDSVGNLPDKPVVLSFDDCYYNNYLHAYPLLEEYNAKIIISVIGELTQKFSDSEDENPDYAHLSWQRLEEMVGSGRVELANHTWGMHKNSGRDGCCRKEGEDLKQYERLLRQDVGRLQTMLEDIGPAPCFTYPFGSKCPEALDALKRMGFRASLSCYEGLNRIERGNPDCLYDLRRCNRAPGKSVEQILGELGCE